MPITTAEPRLRTAVAEGEEMMQLNWRASGTVPKNTMPKGDEGHGDQQALRRNARLDRDRVAAAGSGLGLAVVKEIADANGWRITSRAARQTGASIRVHLPGDTAGPARTLAESAVAVPV
jgi:hypothetical protein